MYMCYFLEKLIYGCFVFAWLVCKTEPNLWPWAIVSLQVVVYTVMLVVLNEMILQKVEIVFVESDCIYIINRNVDQTHLLRTVFTISV